MNKINLDISGAYKKSGNKYLFKDNLIICGRKGSTVQTKNNKIILQADVTGIDKVYFKVDKSNLKISNSFKDFLNSNNKMNRINKEFIEFQREKGYVPYPFTILKNVMKAPPGLVVEFKLNELNEIQHKYYPSNKLKVFNKTKNFEKKNFRTEFTKIIRDDAKKYTSIVSSFSGGFDSTFLTKMHIDKCKTLLHFSENDNLNLSKYKQAFKKCNWIIINNEEKFTEQDKLKYIKNVNEPNCDSAGFAEYLLLKKAKKTIKSSCPIMNGQGCDGIFTNGKIYFQNFISSKIPSGVKSTLIINSQNKILDKLQSYSMETKNRFMNLYLGNYSLPEKTKEEICRIYDIYTNNINNDSTNKLAACIVTLKYSLHGIEKIKTAAHAHNMSYYLPFMSENAIEYAFSIPSKYKVGFNTGKKILIESYPEINKISFTTKSFLPQKLKERFAGKKVNEKEYCAYYLEQWMKINSIKTNER